jgi:hypothetical protein
MEENIRKYAGRGNLIIGKGYVGLVIVAAVKT